MRLSLIGVHLAKNEAIHSALPELEPDQFAAAVGETDARFGQPQSASVDATDDSWSTGLLGS